jgi:hypothetical protein
MEFAILLHMDDLAKKKDSQGRLPLHVAAQNHAACLVANDKNRDPVRADHALIMVLEACPSAANAKDAEGNLPLAVAIEEIQRGKRGAKAWSRGLQQLLECNLAALEALDLDESLYPYIWSKRVTSVDHLFRSIRRHPGLFDSKESQYTTTVGC